MELLIQLITDLFQWLGWFWGLTVILILYALICVRTVRSGFRGVYFRFGKAVTEVGPGAHWRPFPVYRFTKLFCGEQLKDLTQGLQEVVTSDGVTCRLEGGVSYEIADAIKACTVVDDPDEQMALEAMSQIRDWVASKTYKECIQEELGKKMMGKVTKRASRWGLKIIELNIVTFAPANTEARALVFLLDVAKRRAQSAQIFVAAIKELAQEWRPLGISPSILLASIAGVPISAVTPADQLTSLRGDINALKRALQISETDGDAATLLDQFANNFLARLPGGDVLAEKLHEAAGE